MQSKSPAVLVTGGTGYLGAVLVAKLKEHKYDVVTIARRPSRVTFFGVKHYEGDLSCKDLLSEALADVTYVVHLASLVGYPSCDKKPNEARLTNIDGSLTLLSCLQPHHKLIFASSVSVYGTQDKKDIIDEEASCHPCSLYSETKFLIEKPCLEKDAVILRIAALFGIGITCKYDVMVNSLVEQCLKKKVSIYDADEFRNVVHVKDAADGILFTIKNFENMKGQIFNLGDDSLVTSKREIINLILKYKPDILVEYDKDFTDPEGRTYRISFQKIQKLGYRASFGIEDGIKELVNYYQKLLEEK